MNDDFLGEVISDLFKDINKKNDTTTSNTDNDEYVETLCLNSGPITIYKDTGPLPAGTAGFWCSSSKTTLLLSKRPDEESLHICIYMQRTYKPKDINSLTPDYCFDIVNITKMPNKDECISIACQFMDRPVTDYEVAQQCGLKITAKATLRDLV